MPVNTNREMLVWNNNNTFFLFCFFHLQVVKNRFFLPIHKALYFVRLKLNVMFNVLVLNLGSKLHSWSFADILNTTQLNSCLQVN